MVRAWNKWCALPGSCNQQEGKRENVKIIKRGQQIREERGRETNRQTNRQLGVEREKERMQRTLKELEIKIG